MVYMYSLLEDTDYTDDFKAIPDEAYHTYRMNKEGNTRVEVDSMIKKLWHE